MNLKKFTKGPSIIRLGGIGSPSLGYISVLEQKDQLPFDVKRVYWTYYTPNEVQRGGHAHKNLSQIIVSVSGIIEITVETLDKKRETFILDSPQRALYLDSTCWREMKFSHNAVLLCLASENYDEDDYIRDYKEFQALQTS